MRLFSFNEGTGNVSRDGDFDTLAVKLHLTQVHHMTLVLYHVTHLRSCHWLVKIVCSSPLASRWSRDCVLPPFFGLVPPSVGLDYSLCIAVLFCVGVWYLLPTTY